MTGFAVVTPIPINHDHVLRDTSSFEIPDIDLIFIIGLDVIVQTCTIHLLGIC